MRSAIASLAVVLVLAPRIAAAGEPLVPNPPSGEQIEEIADVEVVESGSPGSPSQGLWPVHAVIAGYCTLLFLINLIIARRRNHDRAWLPKHKTLGLFAPATLLIGIGTAYYMVALWHAGHFRVPHACLGLAVGMLAVLLPILGALMGKVQKARGAVRALHVWIGRIAVALMIAALVLGFSAVWR